MLVTVVRAPMTSFMTAGVTVRERTIQQRERRHRILSPQYTDASESQLRAVVLLLSEQLFCITHCLKELKCNKRPYWALIVAILSINNQPINQSSVRLKLLF